MRGKKKNYFALVIVFLISTMIFCYSEDDMENIPGDFSLLSPENNSDVRSLTP